MRNDFPHKNLVDFCLQLGTDTGRRDCLVFLGWHIIRSHVYHNDLLSLAQGLVLRHAQVLNLQLQGAKPTSDPSKSPSALENVTHM